MVAYLPFISRRQSSFFLSPLLNMPLKEAHLFFSSTRGLLLQMSSIWTMIVKFVSLQAVHSKRVPNVKLHWNTQRLVVTTRSNYKVNANQSNATQDLKNIINISSPLCKMLTPVLLQQAKSVKYKTACVASCETYTIFKGLALMTIPMDKTPLIYSPIQWANMRPCMFYPLPNISSFHFLPFWPIHFQFLISPDVCMLLNCIKNKKIKNRMTASVLVQVPNV